MSSHTADHHQLLENWTPNSEQAFRKLFESMRDAFVSVSMNGRIVGTNKAYQQLTGYSHEELSELTYIDLTPPEWHQKEARIVAEHIIPCGHSEIYEKEYRRKDGSIIPVELRTFLVRDNDGQPAAMWAIVRDLTERHQQREETRKTRDQLEQRVADRTRQLLESEERFRQLTEASFEAIGVSHEGIILDINRQFTELLGWERDEVIGRPNVDFAAPNSRAMVTEHIKTHYETPYQLDLQHRDGTIFPAEVRSRMVKTRDRAIRLTAIRDLRPGHLLETEFEQQRQKLASAERLARLAEIGLGISHQLGQPLCAVMNNVAAARASIFNCDCKSCDARELILDLERDAIRMSEITDRLRLLAQPRGQPPESICPNQLVTDGIELILRDRPSTKIQIRTDLDPGLPAIPLDRVQISQVLENLILNAIDAVEATASNHPRILIASRRPSPTAIEITISDNGPGINPDDLPRIFDLFFTTRQDGTGVGLAICRRIIEAHDGTLDAANNQQGPGAVFRLTLPATTPKP